MPIRIKPLLLDMMKNHMPDFQEMTTKRKGYWFRNDTNRPCYEAVIVGSSQKERVLTCDVAWGLFPTWDGSYGTHQMTALTPLPALRLGDTAIPAQESYYEHDGTEAGMRLALDRIGSELTAHALPWFRSRAEDADNDRLLQHGLDWVRANLQDIPATIKDDLEQALVKASYLRWRVELPLLDALKSDLREFAAKIDASASQRKETRILAFHLLLYAGDMKRDAP